MFALPDPGEKSEADSQSVFFISWKFFLKSLVLECCPEDKKFDNDYRRDYSKQRAQS